MENGEWIATLGGYGRDYPPTDDEGFLAFARSLRSPLIYDSIRDAEPLTPAVATRSTANVWRHYERLTRWPDGFIAMGDAVCAFNPVYGQGMSVAAKEAAVLDTYLREQRRDDLTGFAPRFQKRIAREVAPVWAIATGEDVKVPGVEGGQPRRSDRLIQAYMERVVALTTEDAFARNIFTQVTNLERPATLLFHPRLVAKVILGPTGRGNRSPMSTPVVA
jgi:2-polyprenyl-6-methoxyphenol hydroxylase-like FAD-dependent oxidoreductase